MKHDAQFTIRLPLDLKEEMQQSAKAADIDAVVWIRHAIREKLEREKKYAITDEFRMAVRDVIEEYNAEKKEG